MTDDKLRATPAARKLADDLGINLYDVSGTGAKGRVHKEDIESYRKFTKIHYCENYAPCKTYCRRK